MSTTLAAPRGPRYHLDRLDACDVSGSVRAFRAWTERLGALFPVPGLGNMRAGKQVCLHTLVTRFLTAGLRFGLDRAWANQLAGFVQGEIDRLWSTPCDLGAARLAAQQTDSYEDVAEITALTANTLEALRSEERAVVADQAREEVRLTALRREIARRERELTPA